MRKIIFLSLLLTNIISYSFAISYSSDPKDFVNELVVDALQILKNKDFQDSEKKQKIKEIAVENVDIKALGLYTLGDIRKSLDDEKLKKYHQVFEEYFLKSLTSRLTDYSSQKFEVVGFEKKSAKYTIVQSKLFGSETPEIKVDWRIYTKNPDKPLIRDLIVEGLSLARTQKEEFASILTSNNNDINILFNKLEEFISN
jgi:phospholipid transport system substrate-binding protein